MDMAKRVIRVGGVHEPFNLPWIRAFEHDAFADYDLEVTFEAVAGGTGALVDDLEDGIFDLATLLTEGAVTAIANGSGVRLHSSFTASPLLWGIHTAADAKADTVSDLKGKRFAISRHGSGSELMAYVLAANNDWELSADQFVVVGGIDGAVDALGAGEADVFLWERRVTAPLVKQGIFKRVDDLETRWPAFYTAARPGLIDQHRELLDVITQVVLNHAGALKADRHSTVDRIVADYGLAKRDARTWLNRVEWPARPLTDNVVLRNVMARMVELGRIDTPVPIHQLSSGSLR